MALNIVSYLLLNCSRTHTHIFYNHRQPSNSQDVLLFVKASHKHVHSAHSMPLFPLSS